MASMIEHAEQLDRIISKMKTDDVKFVRFEFGDMYGVSRSKIIPISHFIEKATRGLKFNPSYLGWDYRDDGSLPIPKYSFIAGIRPDAVMFSDLDTYVTIPWRKNTGRILIEPTLNGEPLTAHPRIVARRQLDVLREHGFSLLSAFEHEFFIVDKDTLEPYSKGNIARSTLRNYADPEFTHQILTDLPEVGVDIEVFENEFEAGQVEIVHKPSFGIRAADTSHTCHISVKEIALEHGYIASFMTKPWAGKDASGLHFNHSLWDVQGQNSKMMDKNSSNGLSKVARNWIAGILAHAPAISVLMAPTNNCLKRYEAYSCAPIGVTWGFDNRTTALRVTQNTNGDMYIENRLSSGAANPYLVLAATAAAGIDGIKHEMEPPEDVKGNACEPANIPAKTAMLPTDMKTALEHFSNDNGIREALGEDFYQCYTGFKLSEILMEQEAKEKGNTSWEREFLFERM
ncbi:lengsin-like [Amphiura filiformis]|uniref:lengsin-like n=1 Tax=Amphiura filiformis TaxID=82378 RepID=UPI003B20B6B5